jgi:Uma2 family endonuclease
MSSLPQPFVTPEEYLEAERKAEYRSEYLDGQVHAMAGTSRAHGRITLNLARRLDEQLENGPCEVFVTDLKVRVATKGPYFYPDLVVVCGAPQLLGVDDDVILNPKVVIEVLSPSTESYDRGKKFQAYARHESLAEYVLVAQDHVQGDHYVRQPNGHWDFTSTSDADGVIEFPSIGARVKVADIYSRVNVES